MSCELGALLCPWLPDIQFRGWRTALGSLLCSNPCCCNSNLVLWRTKILKLQHNSYFVGFKHKLLFGWSCSFLLSRQKLGESALTCFSEPLWRHFFLCCSNVMWGPTGFCPRNARMLNKAVEEYSCIVQSSQTLNTDKKEVTPADSQWLQVHNRMNLKHFIEFFLIPTLSDFALYFRIFQSVSQSVL